MLWQRYWGLGETGDLISHISSCINGKLGSSKGFMWRSGAGSKKISTKNLMTLEKSIEKSKKKLHNILKVVS